MKKTYLYLITIVSSIALIAGCASGPKSVQTCRTAEATLAAYRATLEGSTPSNDQIIAANAAAVFLAAQCGWIYEEETVAKMNAARVITTVSTQIKRDRNGVPIVNTPGSISP